MREAGFKRNIPVHYLVEENQFQWGYGKRHVRGRSTTFHTDGIKDTEFTMYKDMCKTFCRCAASRPRGP
jgi:cyanophycin synthetase